MHATLHIIKSINPWGELKTRERIACNTYDFNSNILIWRNKKNWGNFEKCKPWDNIQQIKLALCVFVYLTKCQGDYNHDTINRVDSPQNSIQNLQRSFRSWN